MFKVEAPAVDIPDGTYKASLIGVTDKNDGKSFDGKYRLWDWLLEVPGTAEPVPYSDTTSQGMGPGSNSYKRLAALLQVTPEVGKEYDPPIGKMALLRISHIDYHGKPTQFPKTADVLAYVAPATSEGGTPR